MPLHPAKPGEHTPAPIPLPVWQECGEAGAGLSGQGLMAVPSPLPPWALLAVSTLRTRSGCDPSRMKLWSPLWSLTIVPSSCARLGVLTEVLGTVPLQPCAPALGPRSSTHRTPRNAPQPSLLCGVITQSCDTGMRRGDVTGLGL